MEKKSQSSFAQVKSKIKVVFLGQQSTGKTSILTRFIHDKFEDGLGPTIGIDFMAKNLHIGNNILRMQLWDTAGQQRFRSLIPSYLKDALIAFIVFDLTSKRSFENLHEWIDLCQNNRNEKTIVIMLGNKSDLKQAREVDSEAVKAKIEETSLPYFQVSAKTGDNIKEAFIFAGNEYFNMQTNNAELTFTTVVNEHYKQENNELPKSNSAANQSFANENRKQMDNSNKKNDAVKLQEQKDKKKKKGSGKTKCC